MLEKVAADRGEAEQSPFLDGEVHADRQLQLAIDSKPTVFDWILYTTTRVLHPAALFTESARRFHAMRELARVLSRHYPPSDFWRVINKDEEHLMEHGITQRFVFHRLDSGSQPAHRDRFRAWIADVICYEWFHHYRTLCIDDTTVERDLINETRPRVMALRRTLIGEPLGLFPTALVDIVIGYDLCSNVIARPATRTWPIH